MNPKKSGTFLDKIVAKKKRRVEDQKKRRSLNKISAEAETISSVKDFRSAIKRKKRISLIAEIKKNSPLKSRLYQNKGLLNKGFKPSDLARCYDQAGADAISVITEEDFFYGSPDYLKAVRLSTTLPVLRKDFIFDPYQIYESRAMGADAVLIIVAILNDKQLADLITLTRKCGLTALVEIHSREELKRALDGGSDVIGINNRNLKTMRIDLSITERLIKFVPKNTIVVSESGIRHNQDVQRFDSLGVDAILVGESIVTAADIEKKIHSLRSKINDPG